MKLNNIALKKTIQICLVSLFIINSTFAQDNAEGQISGNFQIMSQYYLPDSANGAVVPKEFIGFNSFANINYVKGKFSTGVRFESYEPALLGYPASPNTKYSGSGLGYRYAKYNDDDITITVGNFYEQFGSGIMLRTYEERNLGVDNSLDGINVNYRPYPGITLKGIYGRQRIGFTDGTTKGDGVVRGADADFMLNDMLDSIYQSKTRVSVGLSFVSKYQADDDADLILPENVGTYGGRININRGKVNIFSEYAYKINDPSSDNGFVYADGQAFKLNGTFSQKGLGISLGTQFIDNMSYRSDRNKGFTDLLINYIPSMPRQHTYNLPATLYPYATQLNGEIGFTGEITYKFKKGTGLGGKYGTTVSLNSSFVKGIDTTNVDNSTNELPADIGPYGFRRGYNTNIFSLDGQTYFRDIHLEVNKKFNKKIKANFMLANFVYNIDVLQGKPGKENVGALIEIVEVSYKINRKHSLRGELQALQVGNFFMKDTSGSLQTFELKEELDHGHWITAILEYSYSPHWFVALQDQYNLGNSSHQKLHYPLMSFGYTKNATRFMVTGGRQRAGLFCVGGVCRVVPASTGVSLTITSSF